MAEGLECPVCGEVSSLTPANLMTDLLDTADLAVVELAQRRQALGKPPSAVELRLRALVTMLQSAVAVGGA